MDPSRFGVKAEFGASTKERELFAEAVALIALSKCEKNVRTVENCINAHSIEKDSDDVKLFCGNELNYLDFCLRRVNKNDIAKGILDHSTLVCTQEAAILKDCVNENGLPNCQQELLDVTMCGAEDIISDRKYNSVSSFFM